MIHLSQIVLISYCKNLHGCISVHSANIPNLNENVAVCDVKPDRFCCAYLVRDSGTCRQRAKWRRERETSWLLLFLLVFFLLLLLFLMCCSLHKHKETKSKVKLKVGARLYHSHCFVNVGQTFGCFPNHIPLPSSSCERIQSWLWPLSGFQLLTDVPLQALWVMFCKKAGVFLLGYS